MNVIQKSASGITLLPINSKLFSKRKIFLEGGINMETAVEFVKEFLVLSEEDKDSTIDIFINSPGGEITAGMMIYDIVTTTKVPYRMICIGQAFSMAAVIFCAGTKGKRFILPHSQLMLHEPLLSTHIGGNCTSIKNVSETLLETRQLINGLLSKHCDQSIEEVEKACSYDHFFSASEAIDFGLCDAICEFSELEDNHG